mmetsp:Transcript_81831/g.258076  ORF Transcript_81831/g.258076 Transcript_81831/m.258076 type:complete len:317 (+) Transcript_81831:471-1421(+)
MGVEVGVVPIAALEVGVVPSRRGQQLEGVGVRMVGVLGHACHLPLDNGVCGGDVHVGRGPAPKVACHPARVAAQAEARGAAAVGLGCGPGVLQVRRPCLRRPRPKRGLRRQALGSRSLDLEPEDGAEEAPGEGAGLRAHRPHLVLRTLGATDDEVSAAALREAYTWDEAGEVAHVDAVLGQQRRHAGSEVQVQPRADAGRHEPQALPLARALGDGGPRGPVDQPHVLGQVPAVHVEESVLGGLRGLLQHLQGELLEDHHAVAQRSKLLREEAGGVQDDEGACSSSPGLQDRGAVMVRMRPVGAWGVVHGQAVLVAE